MAAALSNSTENLEKYSLIWLDASVNQSSTNRQAQQQLKTIINHLLPFEDDQQCLRYIKNLSKTNRIILIASGRSGRQIVPQINNLPQIISIYIYCMDKQANIKWSKEYNKVKNVVTRLDELFIQIQIDYSQQEDIKLDESLSMKIFDDEQFFHYQLLINCLIRMKSLSDEKNDLTHFCRQYYQNNHSQLVVLREFSKNYTSNQSLEWYNRHSFLSRLLTKALDDENIDLLYLFRFFIYDISYQLGQNLCLNNIHVYRSQLVLNEELKLLKNSLGKFLSFNSFLSTNLNEDKTRSLLYSTDISNEVQKVFFHIQANSQLHNIKPFNHIQSDNKNNQVIFMIGSIFRVEKIECDKDQIWNIQLTLCSIKDEQLKSLSEKMKDQLGNGHTNLLQFSHILRRMGKLNHAEKYCRRYLNQLPDNHQDISNCYQTLGIIAEGKKDFISSLKWYKRSLKTFQQPQKFNNLNLAEIYNNIANVYFKTKDYTKAIKSYEKALAIWKNNFGEEHPRIIKCFNDIGAVYDMKKQYSDALASYQKALDIAKKVFKPKDPEIAMIYRNIANVYEFQDDFKQALKFYEKAIKIFRHLSPSMNAYVNDVDTSIQRVSSKLK